MQQLDKIWIQFFAKLKSGSHGLEQKDRFADLARKVNLADYLKYCAYVVPAEKIIS